MVAPSLIGGVAQATSLTASFWVVTALACGLVAFAGVLRAAERGDRAETGARGAAVPDPRS
jgi:hypothetical protein